MSKQVVLWLVIAAYAVFMLVIGLVNHSRSKSMTDFTVGSRNSKGWLSALSYGTAYFSAVMFIGYAGKTGWGFGAWAVLPGIGNAIFGSLLAWLVLANRTRETTRRLKIKSMPQFFDARYDSKAMKLFCALVIFVFLIPYSASVYKGLTSVCSVLLNIPENICMIIIAVASALIIVLSGYVGALKADGVQGLIMMVGVILMIIFVIRSDAVGGLVTGMERLSAETAALNLTGKDHLALWGTVLMTSFGTWGLPQMIHKYYGIKDKKEVKTGTIICTVFGIIIGVGGYFVGSLGHVFFKELPEGGVDYVVPHMLLNSQLPNVLLGVVLMLLISASVSTLSSVTLTACSTLTMDVIAAGSKKEISKTVQAVITKTLCVVFVVISFVIANSDTLILDMMSYSWGIISGSFLAPYAIALYWRGLNRAGAWAGMLGGFFTALPPVIAKLFANGWMAPFGLGEMMNQGPLFACLAMIVSVILCFAVSLATGGNTAEGREKNKFFYEGRAEGSLEEAA